MVGERYEAMYAFRYWQQGGSWYHPYAFHVYAMLIGFALVMRIQIAYQRFWEGTTQCHLASSKWSDAVMQVMAFDEASKDAFSEEALEFRMLILHYTSLMNACALIDIRRDDDDCPLTLNREDPYARAHSLRLFLAPLFPPALPLFFSSLRAPSFLHACTRELTPCAPRPPFSVFRPNANTAVLADAQMGRALKRGSSSSSSVTAPASTDVEAAEKKPKGKQHRHTG